MSVRLKLVGERFGRLLVTASAGSRNGKSRWTCRCDCGLTVIVGAGELRAGNTRSCGCLRSDRSRERHLSHGRHDTVEYHAWMAMKQRCSNPRVVGFANWGGRGIGVCERWRDSFETFLADMGSRPPGTSLDRIDNDGNYEPGNCRWATRRQQRLNSRTPVRWLTINGETAPMADWAKRNGIPRVTATQRVCAYGWDPIDAVTRPVRRGKQVSP